MKKKTLQIPVPKSIWFASLITVMVILLTSHMIFNIRNKTHRAKKNIIRISDKLVLDSSVYIFGTSITRKALSLYDFVQPGRKTKFEQYSYKVLTNNGGQPYEFLPLVEQAVEKGDCIIFIEANMLCSDIYGNRFNLHEELNVFSKLKRSVIYHQYRSYLTLTKYLLKLKNCVYRISKIDDTNLPKAERIKDIDWQDYGDKAAKIRARNLEEISDWLPVLKKASEKNVKFFLLDVPRPQKSKSFESVHYNKKFSEIIKALEIETDIQFIHFPYSMDFPESYVDARHMNLTGSEDYTTWFETKLDSILISNNLGR